jgi:hypothetical protein
MQISIASRQNDGSRDNDREINLALLQRLFHLLKYMSGGVLTFLFLFKRRS